MRFVLYTNALSAHQIPLAREIAKRVGHGNFRYIYTSKNGQKLQESQATDSWVSYLPEARVVDNEWLNNAEVVIVGGIRPFDFIEQRLAKAKTTLYMSERWFKPSIGMLRLLYPKYLLMAWRFVRMLRKSDQLWYLPIGIHAARDMARLCGLFAGDWWCLFRAPKLEFERKPGGRIWISGGARSESVRELGKKYCLDKMRMFCYTVAPSDALPGEQKPRKPDEVRVLWVGRLLALKRVDTIVRAVSEHAALKRVDNSRPKITLDIYGSGPEEVRLKQMVKGYEDVIKFHPPVPITEVRKLMREHDVYVLSSNGYEGWGAVVSEALEEGMKLIGTYEAGSSATILPESCLYHAGDWRALATLLAGDIQNVGIGEWTAEIAAKAITQLAKEVIETL